MISLINSKPVSVISNIKNKMAIISANPLTFVTISNVSKNEYVKSKINPTHCGVVSVLR